MDDSDPEGMDPRDGRNGGDRRGKSRAGEPRASGPGPTATPPRRPAPPAEAPVVDLFTGRRLSRPARRAARDRAAVLDGSTAVRPVVLFCHLRGDADPFPRRWQWGKLTVGADRPVWQRIRIGRPGAPVTIPAEVEERGLPRRILRSELSAFCPSPRRALVIPLEAPAGKFLVGVRKSNVETVLAAVLPRGRSNVARLEGRWPGTRRPRRQPRRSADRGDGKPSRP